MDKDIREFYDEFIRFKREVTDTLENLDESNFSGNMKKIVARLGGASAGFEAYADAKQAVARMFAEYKTEINKSIASVEAIANANGASITQLVTWQGDVDNSINDLQISDSTLAKSISKIEQTADANGAFIELIAHSGNTNIDITKGYQKNKDGTYTFYDSDNKPITLSESDFAGIYINALNDGTTEIKLNANVIEFGDYASVDNYGNFYAKRLWGDSSGGAMIGGVTYPGFFYAEVGSGRFDHDKDRLKGADLYLKSYSGGIMYGFKHDWTQAGDDYPEETHDSVNFVVGGHDTSMENVNSVWGYNYGNKTFYPKGAWDFSVVKVTGLGVVPVFGE